MSTLLSRANITMYSQRSCYLYFVGYDTVFVLVILKLTAIQLYNTKSIKTTLLLLMVENCEMNRFACNHFYHGRLYRRKYKLILRFDMNLVT